MYRTYKSYVLWIFLSAVGCWLSARPAYAQDLRDRFNIRLSMTGMYLGEQGYGPTADQNQAEGALSLGYAELRTVIDARRLPGNFELHLDARVRITPDEVDAQNGDPSLSVGASKVWARGYFGGREYEVKQAWVRRRGERFDFALGRLVVGEADALRLDGARGWLRFGQHWDVSAFAGAYPNPYSRSVTTDYATGTFAGGADTSYTYDKIWGSISAVGIYLGGNNDGSPLDANMMFTGKPSTETPRAYLTWTDFVRPLSWLDFFSDLVVDVAGSSGAQLTRADLLATARAGKYLTFRAGYDHLSSLAIEMYLASLLANPNPSAPLPIVANTIENNLVVMRTARDQGRLDVDFTLHKLSIYLDARIRHRALENPNDDPSVNNPALPNLAYDVTVGLRDRGTLKQIRAGTWLTYLSDFRATSIIWDLDVGRDFWVDKLSLDLSFLYARTKDAGAGSAATCTGTPTGTMVFTLLQQCWGTRDGAEYELGLTVAGAPFKHWTALADYRLVIDDTGGKPNILTHLLLLRLEARY